MNHPRIVTILAVVGLLALITSQAHATLMPQLEWIQTYDSPAHSWDEGNGVAVDVVGNVYVTGLEDRNDLSQSYNIGLRKYDTDGNTLWTQTYDSPAHSWDEGRSVTVDTAGNIYVTGSERRDDLGQSSNIWLGKYDTDGNALWTQTYDSPAHSHDYGRGVMVDSAGNVYITGYEERNDLSQNYNIWLRKYDTDGNTLWTQTYDSPDHGRDRGFGVTVDTAGNIYVTGFEDRFDLGQAANIWLRKYDINGNTLWTQTYDSPASLYDSGHGVAVDATGNVYVIGREDRRDLGQENNIWLRKYDTDGNTLWTETYNSPANDSDYGRGVVVDAAGNIYVAGYERRDDLGQFHNIWLRKYDTDGNTLWTETYDSPAHKHDRGYGVAVDSSGNVYVTGYEDRDDLGQGPNIILLKYAQVPEPSTLLLLAPALLGLAGVLRKKFRGAVEPWFRS